MSAVLDVIGSANIRDTLPDAAAQEAVRAWLSEGVELGALQEWARGRDRLIPGGHIKHGRGDQGGGPIVWNATRYEPVRPIKAKRLVGGGLVGRLPGRRSTLGPSWATLGVFHDEVLGQQVSLINVHLTAEVQQGAGYRKDGQHAKRVRRHKAEVRAIKRLVLARRLRGDRVYVVGDTNYDGLELEPLVSCWKGRSGGTLGGRAVDYVFAPERADRVQTIHTKSDHRAVVATYRRKP